MKKIAIILILIMLAQVLTYPVIRIRAEVALPEYYIKKWDFTGKYDADNNAIYDYIPIRYFGNSVQDSGNISHYNGRLAAYTTGEKKPVFAEGEKPLEGWPTEELINFDVYDDTGMIYGLGYSTVQSNIIAFTSQLALERYIKTGIVNKDDVYRDTVPSGMHFDGEGIVDGEEPAYDYDPDIPVPQDIRLVPYDLSVLGVGSPVWSCNDSYYSYQDKKKNPVFYAGLFGKYEAEIEVPFFRDYRKRKINLTESYPAVKVTWKPPVKNYELICTVYISYINGVGKKEYALGYYNLPYFASQVDGDAFKSDKGKAVIGLRDIAYMLSNSDPSLVQQIPNYSSSNGFFGDDEGQAIQGPKAEIPYSEFGRTWNIEALEFQYYDVYSGFEKMKAGDRARIYVDNDIFFGNGGEQIKDTIKDNTGDVSDTEKGWTDSSGNHFEIDDDGNIKGDKDNKTPWYEQLMDKIASVGDMFNRFVSKILALGQGVSDLPKLLKDMLGFMPAEYWDLVTLGLMVSILLRIFNR